MAVRTPPSVDLTGAGGFKIDLKTGLLLIALGMSWRDQSNKIDTINTRLDLEAKSRAEVMVAREALAAQQQMALAASLAKLEGQLKITSMDVGDLKTEVQVLSKGK